MSSSQVDPGKLGLANDTASITLTADEGNAGTCVTIELSVDLRPATRQELLTALSNGLLDICESIRSMFLLPSSDRLKTRLIEYMDENGVIKTGESPKDTDSVVITEYYE